MYSLNTEECSENKHLPQRVPTDLSLFICELLSPTLPEDPLILDPCVHNGEFLYPFENKGFKVLGVDLEKKARCRVIEGNFLSLTLDDLPEPQLVVMKPPTTLKNNITREYVAINYGGGHGRKNLPQLFIEKTFELFGKDVPVVAIVPHSFRLGVSQKGNRWQKFVNSEIPPIKSIISLPVDLLKGSTTGNECLIFNVANVEPHYFYNKFRQK